MATLSGFIGVPATMLAVIGLYGVISYIILQRRNEIGVRMILRDDLILLGIGLVVGTGLTIAAGTAAASMLYGLKPKDPLTLAEAIAGIVVVGLAAGFLPGAARREHTSHGSIA